MKKQKIFFTLLLNMLIVAAFGQSSVSSTKKGGLADSSIFVTKTYGNATYHPKLGVLPAANGGTGINNSTRTLTFGGNLNFAGAYTQTFTATGNTSVTLPTSGTLATLSRTETFANKTFNSQTSIYNPSTTGASYLNLTNGTTTNSPTTGFIMYLGGETPYPSSQLYSNTGGSLLMGANGQTGITIEPAYGKVKIGPGTTPNARFKIGASTGLFPQLEIDPQALVTPVVNNTIENDGTDFWYTNNSGLRRKFAASATDSTVFSTKYFNSITYMPKFTVLAENKGGKGNATVYQPGSIVFQSATSSQLMEDNTNLKFDSINKTLLTTRQVINGRNGIIPLVLNPLESQAISIESTKGGIYINNVQTDVPGLIVRTDGLGASFDSKEIAVKSTSEKSAGLFTQTGESVADNANPAVSIVRDVNNSNVSGTFDYSGAMLEIIDNPTVITSSHGPLIKASSGGVERLNVSTGGRVSATTQSGVKSSLGGSLFYSVSQTQSVGSTTTDIFSHTINAKTLENDGDEIYVKYAFTIAEASKSKTLDVLFAGVNIGGYIVTPSTAGGTGMIKVSIVKSAAGTYTYSLEVLINEGTGAVLVNSITVFSASATLTSDQTLKLTATCQSGSANGGVKGRYAKGYYNPSN